MKQRFPRSGATSLGLLGLAVALLLTAGILGPSAAQPPLPGGPAWLPPYHLGTTPAAGLVTVLLLGSALLGAAGIAAALWALRHGWAPDPRRLTVAGAVAALAVVCVPPMGSADHLVYAAYGRLAATGGDPYTDTATTLARAGDPVGLAVEPPWQNTPSVYGPVATAEQWFAATVGGTSVHTIVFVLTLLGAAAFLVTGLLLQRMAGNDPIARARVALLWSLNPLLLFVAVNAGHADTFAMVFAVAALYAVRRSPALAGVLVGLACATKISLGLYVLALAWGLRHRPRAVAVMAGSGLVTGLLAYLPVGTAAFEQMRENTRMVSLAVPLRLTVRPMESWFGSGTGRTLIGLLGWLLLALTAWLLWRRSARAADAGPVADRTSRDAVTAAAVLAVAWLLTAPYTLPWYDVAAWAPLVLLGASAVDGVLLARTAVLVCAYIPGRAVDLSGPVDAVARNLRGTVGPIAGVTLLIAVGSLYALSRREAAAVPAPPRSPRPEAAPRP